MNDTPQAWPCGTGQWDRLARLVLADDIKSAMQDEREFAGAMFLETPLDLISELERCNLAAATVLLRGRFAHDEFVGALREIYPGLDIVVATP